MEEKFIEYLDNVAVEHNRIFGTEYTAVFLQEEITGMQLHGIETTITCALLMELKAGILSPTIVINDATEPNEAQAAPDPLGR